MTRPDPDRNRRRMIRLSLLGGIVLFIAGGLYALFTFQSDRKELQAEQLIAQARSAYDAQEFSTVVDLLENPDGRGTTISAIRDDVELLKLYIEARRQTPLPGYEHVLRLVEPLRQIVRINPQDADARRDLLGLLIQLRRDTEALRLAQDLSQQFPDDAELLRLIGKARENLGNPQDALDAFQQARAIDPLHVETWFKIIQLTQELNHDTQPVIVQADQLIAQHPNDPRAELIRAFACILEEDMTRTVELLASAAEREPTDDDFALTLVQWLDRVDRYDISEQYLGRVGNDLTSDVGHESILRHYDSGDLDAVRNRLKDADLQALDTDLVAVWAIACHAGDDASQTAKLIAQLKGRAEPRAQAWAEVLPIVLSPQANHGRRIDTLTAILTQSEQDPEEGQLRDNPYLYQLLAESYLGVAEPDAAVLALQRAAELRPSWARPHALLAGLYLDRGQSGRAYLHAKSAWQRQSGADTAALFAAATLAIADTTDQAQVDSALAMASELLATSPGQAEVLPRTITLLSTVGREAEASQLIQRALNNTTPPSAEVLLTLAELSNRFSLGQDKAIDDALSAHHGRSPAVLLNQATTLAESGQPEQGRRLLESAISEAPSKDWQSVFAAYLTWTGASDGPAYWIALADQHPDDIALQIDALNAPTVRADDAFAKRAIERLRRLGGNNTTHWRIEEARRLMQRHNVVADLKRALPLLREAEMLSPNQLDITLELARCQLLLGEFGAAEQSARRARSIAGHSSLARLLLGQALHEQHRYADAQAELIPVAQSAGDPALRLRAVQMLLEQGETRISRVTLEAMQKAGEADNTALMLLVRVYAAAGQTDRADQVCRQLMQSPDAQVIGFVSAYFAQTGRPELAEQARSGAVAAGLSRAEQFTLDAQQATERGDLPAALVAMQLASEADPSNLDRWRNAAQTALVLAQPDKAITLAERGLKEAGEDAGLSGLVEHRDLAKLCANDRALIPLVIAVLNHAADREASLLALQLVAGQTNPATTAGQLEELAMAHPNSQALHELAGDRLLDAGINDRALRLTSNAMSRFPGSTALARTACISAYRLNDWDATRRAAGAWAKLNPADQHQADLMLASADDALFRYKSVVKTLAPHIGKLPGGLDAYPQHHLLYTRALIRTGQADQAWTLLKPQVSQSPAARRIAMQCIAEDLNDVASATAWLDALQQSNRETPDEWLIAAHAAFQAGMRLNSQGFIDTARTTLDRLLDLPGTHPVDAYNLRGQIAMSQGDPALAETSYRRVLKEQPDNAAVLNNLAMVLAERGGEALREAEQFSERATEQQPNDPNLFDTLAIIRLQRGRLSEAEQAIGRAIALDPENPAWRLTLADIYQAQGKAEQAEIIRRRYSKAGVEVD